MILKAVSKLLRVTALILIKLDLSPTAPQANPLAGENAAAGGTSMGLPVPGSPF